MVQAQGSHAGKVVSQNARRSSAWVTLIGACLAGTASGVVAITGFYFHLSLSAAEPLELFLVLLAALYLGLAQASVASVAAVLCLDYFFTQPLFEFTVADPQNWIALATFETIALIVSRLSSRVRLHANNAIEQQRRALTPYKLSRAILCLQGNQPIAEQLSSVLQELVGVREVSFWTTADDSSPVPTRADASLPTAFDVYLQERDADDAADRTSTRVLRLGVKAIGGMKLRGWDPDPLMADAVASLAALAFERAQAARRESRAEIERDTEQLRTAVLDGLAHGFKTPLTAIQTASSGLLTVGQLSALQAELVSIIDDRVTMLTQLTTELLQTAALDAKQIRLHSKPVFLVDILQKIVREQPAKDRSRFHVQSPPRLVEDAVDVALVELALGQLLDNAAKYSCPNTDIEVTLVHKDQETVISVKNAAKAGINIGPEEKDKLFERFYRGAQQQFGPAGTGLGLSIVKKVAEAHGGRAWVETEASTVRFSLSVRRLEGEQYG